MQTIYLRWASMAKIIRQNFIKNLVFVTGLTRSGKTLLMPIVSSMERVEHLAYNYLMEQVPMMHILGLISNEAAICLMRYAVDNMFYDLTIGRNLNLRFGDLTSVWKSTQPFRYLKRLFAKEGNAALESIMQKNHFFLMQLHDAIWHIDIYCKSFPEMKMIHITRHPINMVHNWYGKGYGGDFFENPRNATLNIEWESKSLPYYAAGWEQAYLNMSEMDRIIHMIQRLEDNHRKKYNSLPEEERSKIKIIPFEKLVTDHKPILRDISEFLGTNLTRHTPRICKRERCPRKLFREDRGRELDKIKGLCSDDAFRILMSMSNEYEELYTKDVIYT